MIDAADSTVTYAVLVWNSGDWPGRRVFYEGTEHGCRRHVRHLQENHRLVPDEFKNGTTRALVEVRPLEEIPPGTRKLADETEGAGEPLG